MNARMMHEKMNEMTKRINERGCRVVYPFGAASPIAIMFGGYFDNAEWITTYPATLHIYGIPGNVTFSDIRRVEQIAKDKYIISGGRDCYETDILVTIES